LFGVWVHNNNYPRQLFAECNRHATWVVKVSYWRDKDFPVCYVHKTDRAPEPGGICQSQGSGWL